MRRVRDVMRLKATGVAIREIARRVEAAPSTVRLTTAIGGCGLSWPQPADMTDSGLEQRLFTSAGTKVGHPNCDQRGDINPELLTCAERLQYEVIYDAKRPMRPFGDFLEGRRVGICLALIARKHVACPAPPHGQLFAI
jgi:hypothetical protein